MYTNRPTSAGGKGPPKGGKGAGDDIPLYDEDELDVLRDELLEVYSTPREKMSTRDEVTERKRTEYYAMKQDKKVVEKKPRDEGTILKLKAKQQALIRLYENVLTEKSNAKKQQTKKSKESDSTESFHKMYTVIHDPVSGDKAKLLRRGEEEEAEESKTNEKNIKVIDVKGTAPPSMVEESDKLTESSAKDPDKLTESLAKERSKFVLRNRLSSLKSKPPPLLEGMKGRASSTDMRQRKDARYSTNEGRYSFDVDVAGPFYSTVPMNQRPPKVRNVATQVLVVDGIRKSGEMEEAGSQTEVEIGSWNSRKFSDDTDKSGRRFSDGTDKSGRKWSREDDLYDLEEEEFEDDAGGDASSSNVSEEEEGFNVDDDDKGKVLERKESKRREAETMARPRGYRDLDLREQIPYVTFEAETHVTAHDLEREQAKQRGISLSKDNILWPSSSEFDIDTASKKIEDYIKRCWTLDPKWLFVIRPLEVYHDNYNKKYIFEAKFSIPSPTMPVPPATASVFFTFEIPMYSLKEDTVKITYVLEGTRFPHHPGKIPFQDKWLWNIISDKLRVQKSINF